MNIKDAYIHNGLGVLRELQVTAAGMLQLKRAAKNSDDSYAGWEDVKDLTAIKPTNAGTADSVPWTGITGKPSSFTPAAHQHEKITHNLWGYNTAISDTTSPADICTQFSVATSGVHAVFTGIVQNSNGTRYQSLFWTGYGAAGLVELTKSYGADGRLKYRVSKGWNDNGANWSTAGYRELANFEDLTWANIESKPETATRWPAWSEVTGKPDTFPVATHNHDDVYVKLDAGQAEQTIKNTISNISNGSIEIWRAISGGYPMIGFATGTTKTKLGLLGFGTTANEPILRTTGGVDYKLWHAGNLTPKTITLSTSAQTYITAGSTNYTLQMPSTDPYTSARTPSAHDHERIKPTRHDSDDPAPNTKGAYLTFQFSYIGGKWWNVLNMRSYTDMKYVSAELLTPANNPGADTGYSGNMMWRQGRNSTWLDMRTILDSANYTDYTVQKDGTGATGTWGIDISGNAATATTATNSDKVDEHHAMSAGSLLYKYAVTATIPASSVSGDFWYATITFARSYVRELTRSMLDASYSNHQGQVYLNTYEYNGAWYAFTTNYNGSNIKGIAHKSQNNPIYYVKLAKPTTYNNAIPDGTITVYSPYNCTITVSATAPSGVTFTDLTTPGFTNLKASSASSADSATTATYASNVGSAGTAGTNYVTAAKVIATCNWYDTMTGSDTDAVINRWSEIVAFVANFEETPDLATFLSNNYLAISGGTMTGPIKWTDSTALPEQQSPQYFVCIDAFNSGGTTKWASKANTLKALTGLTSTAIGDSDEPIYWDGSKFVKAGAYPTKASWNYDDVYLKLAGNSTSNPVKGPIYIDDNGIFIRSKDATKNVWEIVGNGSNWDSSYGFYLQYYGAGSGNNNDLILYTHGQTSTDVEVYRVHQDGSFVFKSVPKVGTNNIYHAGNLTIGTLMGSTAVGDSDEPVYWSGSAFTKCGPFADASHNHNGAYTQEKSLTPPSDYIDFVILLCKLDNTSTSANFYCGGTIYLKRSNILTYVMQKIDFFVGKNYNTTNPIFCNVQSAGGVTPQLVTCTYNSIPYAAFYIKVDSSCYTIAKFEGIASELDELQIIGIYKHSPSETTVLNSEINNSLAVITTAELPTRFYGTPKVTMDKGVTTKDIYHEGNLTIKTLMGSTAIGDSDEPVYWNGTSFVKAGAYPTKSSWNYDDVYLKLTGGTLTDVLTLKAGAYAADNTWTYPGGSYRSVQKPNLRLIGDPTNGLSTIEFISQAGDTSINKPSDCAFIQFQPHGTTTLAAVGSAPTLTASGEVNRLVIGVNNDSNDLLILQTPAATGLKHVVATNSYTIWDAGNDGSGSGLDADLLDGFHAADFRNNIVDLRTSPQTFNPTYLKDIVFISEADYTTLVSNGTITKNSITHTYNSSNWYVIEDKVPEYAENAGYADFASTAGSVAWDNISNKPSYATRWPSWSEVTSKPAWVTWTETSNTSSYSLSNAAWTQTITLPTTKGSYILCLTTGDSTLTGVFSIGASDTAKDEISLHWHGGTTRLYARTNGTKLELSSNATTAASISVTIKYRRMI